MRKNLLSRKAACNSHGQDSSYFIGWQKYEKNPYDPITNPTGIIQMGLAENQLSFDLIESWLESHPNPAGFKRDGASIFRELALFQDYRGFPPLKKALANYMGYLRGNKVRFESNNLVLTAGATSANETLMFCLAEPGEAFLLPTPYYPGYDRDLKWRTGVEIIPIQCSSSNDFQITKAAPEESYQRAKKCNLGVKGVLMTNPSNPLGTTTTRYELDTLLDFVVAKDIHLISDEIYSGTNYGSPGFISVAEDMIGRTTSRTVFTSSIVSRKILGSRDSGAPRRVARAARLFLFSSVYVLVNSSSESNSERRFWVWEEIRPKLDILVAAATTESLRE